MACQSAFSCNRKLNQNESCRFVATMGIAALVMAISLFVIQTLFFLTDIYNVYIFDRVSQDMQALVNSDLEFDYIISECD